MFIVAVRKDLITAEPITIASIIFKVLGIYSATEWWLRTGYLQV